MVPYRLQAWRTSARLQTSCQRAARTQAVNHVRTLASTIIRYGKGWSDTTLVYFEQLRAEILSTGRKHPNPNYAHAWQSCHDAFLVWVASLDEAHEASQHAEMAAKQVQNCESDLTSAERNGMNAAKASRAFLKKEAAKAAHLAALTAKIAAVLKSKWESEKAKLKFIVESYPFAYQRYEPNTTKALYPILSVMSCSICALPLTTLSIVGFFFRIHRRSAGKERMFFQRRGKKSA